MLTIAKKLFKIDIEHTFRDAKEIDIMSENKTELLRLILENDNPEQAVMAAANIILNLLTQHESSEEQASACL